MNPHFILFLPCLDLITRLTFYCEKLILKKVGIIPYFYLFLMRKIKNKTLKMSHYLEKHVLKNSSLSLEFMLIFGKVS